MTWKSRRCSVCSTHWPNTDDYKDCPECEHDTWQSSSEPIATDVAHSRKCHAEFERYYAQHTERQIHATVDDLVKIAAA